MKKQILEHVKGPKIKMETTYNKEQEACFFLYI